MRIDKNGARFLIVYESAQLQGTNQAGVDFGKQSLLSALQARGNAGAQGVQVGFVEMGAQKSSNDCAIFSLNTAVRCSKQPEVSARIIDAMKAHTSKQLISFYDATASRFVKNPESKLELQLPASFHKHDHSMNSIKALDPVPVNRKNESVQGRAQRHKVQREGHTFSNSIEHKRVVYYERASKQLNGE
ncbi:hypothetical protein AQ914_04615 [Burkholderia pseudomallei]|nr:hypothetical protein AQ914_04615 [Burkholderia pseudomallei]